jgi:rhodanese-related sulfurtransferase
MSPVKNLPPSELGVFKNAIDDGTCLLLDVRELTEYEAGHIPSAKARPLSQMANWPNELSKDRTVIVYCRTSNRSRRCAENLSSQGFRDVYVLEGGFNAWSSQHRGNSEK